MRRRSASHQLGFDVVPEQLGRAMNDLQTAVSAPGGAAERGVIARAVDGPPVVLTVEDAFDPLNGTKTAEQVHQLIAVEAIITMKDPAARPLSLAAVFQSDWLAGMGCLLDLNNRFTEGLSAKRYEHRRGVVCCGCSVCWTACR